MKTQIIFLLAVLIVAPVISLVKKHHAIKVMMVTTVIVYGWIAPVALAILLSSCLLQWLCWKAPSNVWFRWLSVMIPLLMLIVFKVCHAAVHWLIPLGLSYYAFRQVHVAFEIYKSTLHRPAFIEYLEYHLFLPVLLVGPIHRMPEFQRSVRRRKWDALQLSEGLERILYGFAKVSFLGNFVCSLWLKQLAENCSHSWLRLYIEVVSFTGNAYFQFAGFSDIAIGAGMVWGIKVMENFNAPFMATNMQEFWQRWHISLSSWCRDYVFQPVAALTRNRWLALTGAMVVLALWHEISLRYIVWGAIQASLILLTVRFRKLFPATSLFLNEHPAGKWLARLWVFHLFAFSCIFIGSESMPSLWPAFKNLF